MGRFLTRDTWGGDANIPITYNRWQYANANPVMYTDPSGNTSIPQYCLAAFGLVFVDGPLPFGDATALVCLLLFGGSAFAGAVTADYVVDAPPGMTPVREIPRMVPLEEILKDCWIVIRPKKQPTPESLPTVYPIPVRGTPSAPTPQPTQTKEPFKKHVALGLDDYLGTFLGELNTSLLKQNAQAYISWNWQEVGLSDVPGSMVAGTFHIAFKQAISRAEHIHFNLQGISNPKEWAENHGRGDVYKDADYVTAWELYNIYHDSAALSKTTFYPNGFTSFP